MQQIAGLKNIRDEIKSDFRSKISDSSTLRLLRIIGSPFITDTGLLVGDVEAPELYDLAIKNKISLLYLEALKAKGRLIKLKPQYEEARNKYTNFQNALSRAAKILNGNHIDYAIFKTIRPYPEVPGDVDTIILGNESMGKTTIDLFLRSDYKEAISDGPTPTTGDLMNFIENVPIDLQQELRLSWLTYMDKTKFRGRTINIKIPTGDEVTVLSTEIDLAVIIIHSMMEQLYLMGEYYTFLYRLSDMTDAEVDMFIDVLREHKIVQAARSHLSLSAALSEAAYGMVPKRLEVILNRIGVDMSEVRSLIRNDYRLPNRYKISTLSKVFLEKMQDRRFRHSVFIQMLKMFNPKLTLFMIRGLIERRRRKYYIKDYVKNEIKFKI